MKLHMALVVVLSSPLAGGGQPEAPLAGPRVERREARASIVSLDVEGRVRRPELSAEEAAVRAMELDEETRRAVDALLARRARMLEEFIENNLDLVVRLVGAGAAPGREKLGLALEVMRATAAIREDGPLDGQVRGLLPAGKRAEFDRLLRGYWAAIGAEDARQLKPKGRVGAVLDEKFKSLGREAEAAYKRCEASGAVLYHYLFGSMELTGEQSRQLRALCARYAMHGMDNQDKKAQGALFVSVAQVLTPEQARELAAKFKACKAAPRKPGKGGAPRER